MSSKNTEYDTHFAGFAKTLWSELEANIKFIPEGRTGRKTFLPMVERIIAQHAYDLVQHTLDNCTSHYDTDVIYDISSIPDFTMKTEDKS